MDKKEFWKRNSLYEGASKLYREFYEKIGTDHLTEIQKRLMKSVDEYNHATSDEAKKAAYKKMSKAYIAIQRTNWKGDNV